MNIIVPSCAAYSDAWSPFMAFFNKFWRDCPYTLTLLTDLNSEKWDGNHAIQFGRDLGWCKSLLHGIDLLPLGVPEFVLILQEDFWLSAPPDGAYIERALEIMKADPTIGCFRLYPCPGPDANLSNPEYGEISRYADYRVSCQAGIWRTTELMHLLQRVNTPQEFEIAGTMYYRHTRPEVRFVSAHRGDPRTWPIQYICTAIIRGQWIPGALDFAKAHGVPVDTSRRSIMGCPR